MVVVLASAAGVSLWLALWDAPRPQPAARTTEQLVPLDPTRIPNPYPDLGIKLDNYPRVDGSTSTQPLQMIVACKLFGLPTEWVHVESDDTRLLSPSFSEGLDATSEDEFTHRYRLGQRGRQAGRAPRDVRSLRQPDRRPGRSRARRAIAVG